MDTEYNEPLGDQEDAPPDPFADVPFEPEDQDPDPVPGEIQPGSLGGEGETLEDLEGDDAPPEPEPESEPVTDEPPVDAEVEDEDAEPEPPKKKRRGTGKTPPRQYAVLKIERVGGGWVEAFPDADPKKAGLYATNHEAALREAYGRLVADDSAEQIELLVIPAHYYKPRKVGATKRVKRAVTIE